MRKVTELRPLFAVCVGRGDTLPSCHLAAHPRYFLEFYSEVDILNRLRVGVQGLA